MRARSARTGSTAWQGRDQGPWLAQEARQEPAVLVAAVASDMGHSVPVAARLVSQGGVGRSLGTGGHRRWGQGNTWAWVCTGWAAGEAWDWVLAWSVVAVAALYGQLRRRAPRLVVSITGGRRRSGGVAAATAVWVAA